MKTIHLTIKVDPTHLRNEMHFQTQLNTRAHVFRAKKGKGSYQRKQKHEQRYN